MLDAKVHHNSILQASAFFLGILEASEDEGGGIGAKLLAKLGLKDTRVTIDPVLAEVNRGIGLTDALIGIPLFIVAFEGL